MTIMLIKELANYKDGGDSGDPASDSAEPEERKVMTQMLSLLLHACSTIQEMIQGTNSNADKKEQMTGHVH